MKILSAGFFLAFGIAIGTAISAVAAGPHEPARPLAPQVVANEYADVMDSDSSVRADDARR